jgi:hypothetical protein
VNTVKFIRVLGTRSRQPSVVAVVDGVRVKWNLNPGWSCDCEDWQLGDDGDSCQHVDAVAELLDDRVLGDAG